MDSVYVDIFGHPCIDATINVESLDLSIKIGANHSVD